MTRANRVTVQTTENGYEARFYRTHKMLTAIASADTEWKANENANATEQRESFRTWVCDHAEDFDIEWNPEYQEQAWERKYKKYATDEQAYEDAITLMNMALTGVADKLGYEWSTECDGIFAKETSLGYIEDGRYVKDGCWAWADITMTVTLTKEDTSIEIPLTMEMVSGQIKKCKMNQTSLKAIIQTEQELQTVA